jgi:tetratricopeptide (TPR) repeat protein
MANLNSIQNSFSDFKQSSTCQSSSERFMFNRSANQLSLPLPSAPKFYIWAEKLIDLGRYDDALTAYKECIKLAFEEKSPLNSFPVLSAPNQAKWYAWADKLLKSGRFDESCDAYREAMNIHLCPLCSINITQKECEHAKEDPKTLEGLEEILKELAGVMQTNTEMLTGEAPRVKTDSSADIEP